MTVPDPHTRYENKCLEFTVADGVDASDILEQYEFATDYDNEDDGPLLTKWKGQEHELLVEGFPWTSFAWVNGDLKVTDRSGSITIDGKLIDSAAGMHGLS